VRIRYFALVSLILFSLYLFITSTFSVWSSPNRVFNATPNTIYLNWTNNYQANLVLTANNSQSINVTVEIFNTTNLIANYTQSNPGGTWCENQYHFIIVQNSSGISNITGPINGSSSYNSTYFTLMYNTSSQLHPCSPGRYRIGNLMVRNYTDSTEYLNISVIVDIPISSNSTLYPLSLSTGIGTFAGTIPTNASTYQSYYFNASSMNYTSATNITSVVISLSGGISSQDIDIFLLDASGNLKAKSINKTDTSEWLVYNYLPTSAEMWEIRIYGNSTNSSGIPYSGNIIFSTLRLTNSSDGQNISSINFGSNMNVTNTSSVDLTLTNIGDINYTGIRESSELYYIQRFNGTGNRNITFLVPNSSIATKVKVSLNWTGGSNYSFNVYKPDSSLILSSTGKHAYANVTNVMQEEYNETTNIGSTSGFWSIDVRNNTAVTNAYNITTYVYVDPSKWINSSFSASGISLKSIGIPNYTYNFTVNFIVPNSTLDGKYEGSIQYKASSGAALRIPIEATTKTGTLIVNNIIDSSRVQIDENIGANLTRVLNITMNNTGSYDLSITHTNSSGILSLSNKNISFTYVSPTNIQAGQSKIVNISIDLNTVNTSDTSGVYEGYIQFITNNSCPYKNFTLILNVNLTNMLLVTFNDISPVMTRNTSAQNISLTLNVTYLNGTSLDNPNNLTAPNSTPNNPSSFSSAWLAGVNVSLTSESLSIYNKSGTVYNAPGCIGLYCINITVPENSLGGTYAVHLFANYTRSDGKVFGGYGISSNQGKYLTINNTGLFMTTNTSNIALYPNNNTNFYVNITNYGYVTSTASLNSINFTKGSCSEFIVSTSSSLTGGCTVVATDSSKSYNVTVPGNSSCLVWWQINSLGTGSNSACLGHIYGDGFWYNPAGLTGSVTVLNTATGNTTTTDTTTTTTTNTTPKYVANLTFTKAETLIIVQQNSSNSTIVQVNNTGNVSQDITFRVQGINSTWFTINASSATLDYKINKSAAFKIRFAVGYVEVNDYAGKYNVTSINKTITKDFTLRVMPAPETQSQINDTLQLYKIQMLNLSEEINQSKQEGFNVSFVEATLNELKSKINEAEGYINNGDYFSANLLLDDIKSLIDQAKIELENAKKPVEKGMGNIIMFVGIGVGVVAISVLGYLFWPSQAYKPRGQLLPIKKLGLFTKLKNLLPKKEIKTDVKVQIQPQVQMQPQPKKENMWDNLKVKWSNVRKQ
jgi:hypothetical protein